jgi:maleate isomerase
MRNFPRIGVLTPSSNTALEPLTSAIIAQIPGASAHFARFKVTEIALSSQALGQFDDSKILLAAEMLADAEVDIITWSGTSSGWLGFDTDERLCERITERTGIPASTAILSLNALLARKNITRLALVSPYTPDVQAELHENIRVNHDFALVDPARLEQMIQETCINGAQAVSTYCTNLHAAQLAEQVEKITGVPLLDTVSTTVWGALTKLDINPAQVKGWGQLYQW